LGALYHWATGLVRTSPGKFLNGGFNLKTHQMFFFQTALEKSSNPSNHRSFWHCVRGKLGERHHVIIVTPSVFKMVSVYTEI